MAISNVAVFPQSISFDTAVATAAVASLDSDAPTNTVSLLTAPTDGTEVTNLTVIPRETCAATVAYLWTSTDAGTTKRLLAAVEIAANTVDTTTVPLEVGFGFTNDAPLRLSGGVELYVGVSVALTGGFVFSAQSRGFTAA